MAKEFVNWYDVLEVGPKASVEVIGAAYRALALKHHPDKGGDTKKMALINRAKEVLSDTLARSDFDRELRGGRYQQVYVPPPHPTRPRANQYESERPYTDARLFVIGFGKFRGTTLIDIAKDEFDYLLWLDRQRVPDPLGSAVTRVISMMRETPPGF